MQTNLPMATEPSVRYDCNFHLIELPNHHEHHLLLWDFVIETKTRTISESIALFLGISYEACIDYIGKNNFTHCQFPNSGFKGHYCRYRGITLEQLQILWNEAQNNRADKYKPILSELILTRVLPLFNQNSQVEQAKPKTMSSLQIAELTGKSHDNIMRDIKNMLKKLNLGLLSFEDTYVHPQNKQTYPCYKLDEELTLTLTSGYSIPQRNAIIKEWQAYRQGGFQTRLCQVETKLEPQTALPAPHIVNASAIRIAISTIDKLPIGEERKAILKAQLLSREFGLNEGLMLPDTPHMLSATEIANKIGLTANAIGRIVNELGIRENQELCRTRAGVATHNNKQVELYFYMPQVVDMIRKHLKQKGNKNGKAQQTNLL